MPLRINPPLFGVDPVAPLFGQQSKFENRKSKIQELGLLAGPSSNRFMKKGRQIRTHFETKIGKTTGFGKSLDETLQSSVVWADDEIAG